MGKKLSHYSFALAAARHSLAVHSAQLLLDTPQHRFSFLAAEQEKHRKEFGHLGTLHHRKNFIKAETGQDTRQITRDVEM